MGGVQRAVKWGKEEVSSYVHGCGGGCGVMGGEDSREGCWVGLRLRGSGCVWLWVGAAVEVGWEGKGVETGRGVVFWGGGGGGRRGWVLVGVGVG